MAMLRQLCVLLVVAMLVARSQQEGSVFPALAEVLVVVQTPVLDSEPTLALVRPAAARARAVVSGSGAGASGSASANGGSDGSAKETKVQRLADSVADCSSELFRFTIIFAQ
ncbi:hypothetical protein EVAR_8398_1 [Eumeta japonica]|uniref:Uncharacterized protein n=1 Tax=Eumeta variegata TaxID=151549 RepID=A0A4C2AEZ2_EUMVA|nr:hypothetical protein EVAR_8398_1 [Eumeta japonica]